MRDLSCHTTDPTIIGLFGGPFHNVRLRPLENGYGWVAYGHPPARRIVAAVVQDARRHGTFAQLRDCVTYMDLCDGMERWWVIGLSVDSDGFLCWHARDARYTGAVPITTIAP